MTLTRTSNVLLAGRLIRLKLLATEQRRDHSRNLELLDRALAHLEPCLCLDGEEPVTTPLIYLMTLTYRR